MAAGSAAAAPPGGRRREEILDIAAQLFASSGSAPGWRPGCAPTSTSAGRPTQPTAPWAQVCREVSL